jgi:hypothetical protein
MAVAGFLGPRPFMGEFLSRQIAQYLHMGKDHNSSNLNRNHVG